MSKKSALGRGLDSLIPVGLKVNEVATPGEQIKRIPLSDIFANPDQPRKEFDQDALKELSFSIKQHGILQPIIVTPAKSASGSYRIIAGERRFRASKSAGLKDIPVIVRNHEELEELEISLVENVQRVDLSPLEQAVSIVKLRDQFSLSPKDISRKLGKAETTISNIIRLLQLPDEAVSALQKGLISEGHARAILSLKGDKVVQLELLNKIIEQKLSVRAAEKFVKDLRNNIMTKEVKLSERVKKSLSKVELSIGLKTIIKSTKKGGAVSISYKNEKELMDLLDRLAK